MHKVIKTGDGSTSIYVPGLEEHYHSINGAIQESEIVFIQAGLKMHTSNTINVFEVGFGTGLNAFLTAYESEKLKINVNYSTIEKYPLAEEIITKLNYIDIIPDTGIYKAIHSCQWNEYVAISNNFQIRKIEADMIEYQFSEMFDLIYFDAFGPDKQPEMWSDEIISKIGKACKPGALFLTYSAKGKLKRQLKAFGFSVEHIPGPPGKREITRAIKI